MVKIDENENELRYYVKHTVNIIRKNKKYEDWIVYIHKQDNKLKKLDFRTVTARHIDELYDYLFNIQNHDIVYISYVDFDYKMYAYRKLDVKNQRIKNKLYNL